MREMVKVLALCIALFGLCASTYANTTVSDAAVLETSADSASGAVAYPVAPSVAPDSVGSPLLAPILRPARLALLLPLQSDVLGQASKAIWAGFLAAYEYERHNIEVDVIDTGDTVEEVLSSYTAALADHDVLIGPLSRSAVAAVSQSDAVRKPTIALNQPEQPADIPLPKKMLFIGLSVEDEARQIAAWAAANKAANKSEGRALIVAADAPWQRRAAKAFALQWTQLGRESEVIELNTSAHYLSASSLAQLKIKIQSEKPPLMFIALDAEQAKETRIVVGKEIPMYGTSQLNSVALADQPFSEPVPELDGIRLLDLPWQLQGDHAAVMIYPHLEVAADQKRNVDMERLYALGIDAFRVAKEIAMSSTNFNIDGVTGKLSVHFGPGVPHFERVEQQAVYREGAIAPLLPQPKKTP